MVRYRQECTYYYTPSETTVKGVAMCNTDQCVLYNLFHSPLTWL